MKKEWQLTQTAFDRLLDWLGPQPKLAGRKYEQIRTRLIKIFMCRGCPAAEDLADETFNRVTAKLEQIAPGYVGDPALYCYGVAHNVYLEWLRNRSSPLPASLVAGEPTINAELEHECLQRCMEQLSADHRELIIQYYQYEKHAKSAHRERLAQQLDIDLNALRIRTHRIRMVLERCVDECRKREPKAVRLAERG